MRRTKDFIVQKKSQNPAFIIKSNDKVGNKNMK